MRKNLGSKNYMFPLPVLMIATYNENNSVNCMNAAWGGISDYSEINIYLAEHKTTDNLRARGAFTVSFADKRHIVESDYLGMVSGNDVPDKVAKCGFTTVKSEFVDAPIINEYPLTLECEVISIDENLRVVAKVINCSCDEAYLDENGKPDPDKIGFISYDSITHAYREVGAKVGQAFSDYKKLK